MHVSTVLCLDRREEVAETPRRRTYVRPCAETRAEAGACLPGGGTAEHGSLVYPLSNMPPSAPNRGDPLAGCRGLLPHD
jgi:hypothetical protein